MLFKRLKFRNIRSYEEMEIEFPEGSLLLIGDIGAGKTSILLALQFALFGLQPGQKGASILRNGEEKAFVSLLLDVDGKEVILERTIKRSKSGGITQDSNTIIIDGVREDLSTSEMKDRVISLLNYPKEFVKKSNLLYKFTVYTPQEEMKSIIQERPEVRLDVIRHIFGMDRYRRIKENSQIFLQKIKEAIKIKEVLVSELNLLKEKFGIEMEKKIALAREINNLQIDYRRVDETRKELEKRLNELGEEINKKKEIDAEILKLNTMIQSKKDFEQRIRKEISMMQKEMGEKISFSEGNLSSILELLNKHNTLLEELNKKFLEINSQISALNSKKEGPQKIREKIISLENCPTCFQTVSKEHKEKIAKRTQYEIEDINRELELKLVERGRILKDIEREKELIKGYEKDKTILQENKIKFEHQQMISTKIKSNVFVLERTLNEISSLEKQIDELKEKSHELEKSEAIYSERQKEFSEVQEIFREKEIKLATKNKELEILKTRLGELEEEIRKKEKINEELNFLRSLYDWIREKFLSMIEVTEKNVMARLRSEFSAIFSEWFSMLVSDSLSVRLDENFTPIVYNQDYELDYDFLSGGERTAVALAYRLSLNRVLNSMLSSIKTKDVIILDEPTDGFASEQINKMRDIFEQLNARQIILVSHEQKIEGFVDYVIRVRKEGVSRIDGVL